MWSVPVVGLSNHIGDVNASEHAFGVTHTISLRTARLAANGQPSTQRI
jgi:hypothetical protein